ncbi:MAG: enoyl-CoA hydratase [Alcaligenaceae bacterium]
MPEQSSPLLRSVHEGVMTLVMNRPERLNALSPELYDQLAQALLEAKDNRQIGAIVLTGAGTAFCAGGDVARMANSPAETLSFEQKVARLRQRNQITELLHTLPIPTIAMIRGPAAGAGLSLALACDFRYADDSAKFKTAFINVGLPGDFGGHYFLPRIVGFAKARELYLLSPTLNAQQAKALGMLTEIFSRDTLEQDVATIAQKFAKGPRQALALMKDNLNQALQNTLSQTLDQEAFNHVTSTLSADHKEAAQAFIEKRPPNFRR